MPRSSARVTSVRAGSASPSDFDDHVHPSRSRSRRRRRVSPSGGPDRGLRDVADERVMTRQPHAGAGEPVALARSGARRPPGRHGRTRAGRRAPYAAAARLAGCASRSRPAGASSDREFSVRVCAIQRHTSPFRATGPFRKRAGTTRQRARESRADAPAHEVDYRGNEYCCRSRRNRPRFIFPGLGQELAPWQLPPGCCGVVGPVPSATRDKVRGTRGQEARYGSRRGRVKSNIFICRCVESDRGSAATAGLTRSRGGRGGTPRTVSLAPRGEQDERQRMSAVEIHARSCVAFVFLSHAAEGRRRRRRRWRQACVVS